MARAMVPQSRHITEAVRRFCEVCRMLKREKGVGEEGVRRERRDRLMGSGSKRGLVSVGASASIRTPPPISAALPLLPLLPRRRGRGCRIWRISSPPARSSDLAGRRRPGDTPSERPQRATSPQPRNTVPYTAKHGRERGDPRAITVYPRSSVSNNKPRASARGQSFPRTTIRCQR
jgi:hypothetical protein